MLHQLHHLPAILARYARPAPPPPKGGLDVLFGLIGRVSAGVTVHPLK